MAPTLTAIHRYPVKGLSPEPLHQVRLTSGETIAFDRAWAIENGPTAFDPAAPKHLPKIAYLMLMRNERLAALRTLFDEASAVLTVCDRDGAVLARGALDDAGGRAALEAFFADYCADELRGPPRIVAAPGHAFTDMATKCISLLNLETVRDLATRLGTEIDPLRFRANLVIDGAPAWSEFDWVGRPVRIGSATLEAFKRIERCAATNVNPQTAERDLTLPRSLLEIYGENAFGIYLTVSTDGEAAIGDEIASVEAT